MVDFAFGIAARKVEFFKVTTYGAILGFAVLLFLSIWLYQSVNLNAYDFALAFVGTLCFALGNFAFAKGVRVGDISILASLGNAWAPIPLILSVYFLHQSLTLYEYLFIAIIIMGAVIVSFGPKKSFKSTTRKLTGGVEYGVLALIGWGFYVFFLALLVADIGWFMAALLIIGTYLFVFLVYGILSKKDLSPPKIARGPIVVMSIFYVINILSYNLGFFLSYASIVAPVSSATAVVTALLAVIFLKEKPSVNQILGMVLVIVGIMALSTF